VSFHLGLDLGGTNIKTVVLKRDGEALLIVDDGSVPTDADSGPEVVTERLIETASEVLEGHAPIETVGLGVPGLFDPETGDVELFPNLPGPWPGYPLRRLLSNGIGREVILINDARAFTLAEGTMGAGRGCRVIVAVVLGTGVGGGIMIDGRLHLGAFGTAGEIAHQVIDPDGALCGCGNRGCVETLTKADALTSLAGLDSAEEVFAAAADGDERALDAIDQVAEYLGLALANAVTLLGPDRVIVGGGISEAGALVLDPITRVVKERVTLVPADRIEVVPAELGLLAGAVGAALAGLDQVETRSR